MAVPTLDPDRRAVRVAAALEDVPASVRPGGFATLHVPTGAPEERAILPSESVQRVGASDVVFVEREPGVYEPVPVDATPLPGGEVAVTGLEEGARVVGAGAYIVRSSMSDPEGSP